MKTDLEIIPDVIELRNFIRHTKIKGGNLIIKDIPSYVNSLEKKIIIYQNLKDRNNFKFTRKYIEFKLGIIINILKNNHGIDIRIKEK